MIKKIRVEKKGVSPVIATVLLVALVVILSVLIFIWFRSMSREAITKFEGENIELACQKVKLDGSYFENELTISNTGNVPIFAMSVKKYSSSGYITEDLAENEDWPGSGLNQGSSAIIRNYDGSDSTKLILIPVLLGESESGQKLYSCTGEGTKEITV